MLRLFPSPAEDVDLLGLYLSERFAPPLDRKRSFVYANYIASLDGRISLPDAQSGKQSAPRAIVNERDWRLFQELAACSDAILVSGRHVRGLGQRLTTRSFPVSAKPEYADLAAWRIDRGLPREPAIVILTETLDLPPLATLAESRRVYVATGESAEPGRVAALGAAGVRVLRAGPGTRVEGRRLVDALTRESLLNVALISGGEILRALLADDVLDRLYLTLACRMLGGASFATLVTGPELSPAAGFGLRALHYDAGHAALAAPQQLFAIFDRASERPRTVDARAG